MTNVLRYCRTFIYIMGPQSRVHKAHLYYSKCSFLNYVPITFLSPRGQPEIVLFWCQIIAHIFSYYNPIISASNYTLEVTAENVSISDIPILIFLCIFITASSLVSHTNFCPRRENKK